MREILDIPKERIFEKLQYQPEPENYSKRIPWTVQQQVAATNGVHYINRIGRLNDYPKFEIPLAYTENTQLLLDIGCGWGRWLCASGEKGYIPIGIDIRHEFCQTARKTASNQGIDAYTVVADLGYLPFQEGIFDIVWSFSVIQHTHQKRMLSCLRDIHRVLNTGGTAKLEFPNKDGLRNRTGPAKDKSGYDDINSWNVRYYSLSQYKEFFYEVFKSCKFQIHSFLGIGILKEDLYYVSFTNKLIVLVSLILTRLGKMLPFLIRYADSIYIYATKKDTCLVDNNDNILKFILATKSNPDNNLNIVHLLQCPISGERPVLSEDRKFLICKEYGYKYPIVDNIPIMVASQAIPI